MKYMGNIKTGAVAMVLLLIASIQVFDSCERRPLEDGYYETARIPVCIDWSKSGVPEKEMHRATVIFFPAAGGAPFEYRLEGDLTYREVDVPAGVYSVLVFNETADPADWNTITFTGTGSYKTFAAVAVPEAKRGFYVYADDLPLVKNPEPLAAWGLDRFEVTKEMLYSTHSVAGKEALRALVPDLCRVVPLPRYERVVITAQVVNLTSAQQATGTLESMASGVMMASGAIIAGSPATHAFMLGNQVLNGNDGTITATFNIFGRSPGSFNSCLMNMDFVLNDGTAYPRETFDVSQLMVPQTTAAFVTTHLINVGYSLDNGDRPITLPNSGNIGSGVTVDDWEEVVVPL